MKRRKSEHGQAIILLTIGIITLLGFTALAIDGGRTYSEKRTIQGVADTSSLTGALYLGKLGFAVTDAVKAEAVAAALARADNNGYDTDHVTVTVTEDANYYYVETDIISTVNPVFAQLVFGGDLTVAAESIARVLKTDEFALGQAFYSKSPSECQAFSQGGTSTLIIENSGIFSNSTSGCPSGSVSIGGTASFGGDVISAVVDNIKVTGTIIGDPPTKTIVPQQTLPTLPTPDCSNLSSQSDSGTSLSPGIYSGGIHITNQDVTLAPGLYCLDSDLRVQGGSLFGDGVTFYLRGNAGVTINGGTVNLYAPQGDLWADGSDMYWNGMLIYQAYGNVSNLTINGNNASELVGTIFVPDGDCSMSGTEDTFSTDIQVICDTIDISGGAVLLVDFDKTKQYVPPMTIDLVQ